jgi:hypothetical protein
VPAVPDTLAWLADKTALSIAGTTLVHADGHYGNGVLARCPIVSSELLDLSCVGGAGGAIAVDLDCSGEKFVSWPRILACGPPSAASRCSSY